MSLSADMPHPENSGRFEKEILLAQYPFLAHFFQADASLTGTHKQSPAQELQKTSWQISFTHSIEEMEEQVTSDYQQQSKRDFPFLLQAATSILTGQAHGQQLFEGLWLHQIPLVIGPVFLLGYELHEKEHRKLFEPDIIEIMKEYGGLVDEPASEIFIQKVLEHGARQWSKFHPVPDAYQSVLDLDPTQNPNPEKELMTAYPFLSVFGMANAPLADIIPSPSRGSIELTPWQHELENAFDTAKNTLEANHKTFARNRGPYRLEEKLRAEIAGFCAGGGFANLRYEEITGILEMVFLIGYEVKDEKHVEILLHPILNILKSYANLDEVMDPVARQHILGLLKRGVREGIRHSVPQAFREVDFSFSGDLETRVPDVFDVPYDFTHTPLPGYIEDAFKNDDPFSVPEEGDVPDIFKQELKDTDLDV